MVGYLILIVLQALIGWFGAPYVAALLPAPTGEGAIALHAAVSAALVWLVGLFASLGLKAVLRPTLGTLIATLIGALAGAGITFVPQLRALIAIDSPEAILPLAGAVIGYLLWRG